MTVRRALTPTPSGFLALDGCGDDVVLVGHSLGGHTLPLVTARRPERHVVYVCAHIPDIGRSLADELRDAPDMLNRDCYAGLSEPDAQRRTTRVDQKLARLLLYADCDEPTVKAAINRLRPQASYPHAVPCSLAEFPSVRSTSVVCREDRMLGLEWAKRVAHDRLGAGIIELRVSHSPFFSRPKALADVILRLAEQQRGMHDVALSIRARLLPTQVIGAARGANHTVPQCDNEYACRNPPPSIPSYWLSDRFVAEGSVQ